MIVGRGFTPAEKFSGLCGGTKAPPYDKKE